MPKRYSSEVRRTALEFVNQGQTQIEVAQALGVNQPPNLRQFPDSFFLKNLWGIDIQVLPGFVLRYTTECSR